MVIQRPSEVQDHVKYLQPVQSITVAPRMTFDILLATAFPSKFFQSLSDGSLPTDSETAALVQHTK